MRARPAEPLLTVLIQATEQSGHPRGCAIGMRMSQVPLDSWHCNKSASYSTTIVRGSLGLSHFPCPRLQGVSVTLQLSFLPPGSLGYHTQKWVTKCSNTRGVPRQRETRHFCVHRLEVERRWHAIDPGAILIADFRALNTNCCQRIQ